MKKPKPPKDNTHYIIKATLKTRGWTDTIIKALLPTPHKTKKNPHYSKGAPMCLYDLAVVEKIEATNDFKALIKKSQPRKSGAVKATQTKKAKTILTVEQLEINVRHEKNVIKRAIWDYNDWNGERDNFIPADIDSDGAFLKRITVNYIRHDLTDYDEEMYDLIGRVGGEDARYVLRKKVYGKIAEVYPEYKDECEKQLEIRMPGKHVGNSEYAKMWW